MRIQKRTRENEWKEWLHVNKKSRPAQWDIQQQNQVEREAAQGESAQQQRIEELVESARIDSQACGLKEGVGVQSEVDSEVKAVQTRFRRVPRGLAYTKHDELRDKIRRNQD